MRGRFIGLAGVALLLSGATPVSPGDAPSLSLPIACVPGKSCFIQQYVDHDTGPGAKDYQCGPQSYDAHSGVDIRLPTLAAQRRGVDVLAAADGIVLALRNDMADKVLTPETRASVKGVECGNGVLIAHKGTWQTQYCHMARGSVIVKPGQAVRAGDRLGQVGLSGETQFPHVHLTVRHMGKSVDPFAPDLADNSCGAGGGRSLWSDSAARMLAYRPVEIINSGFADGPVTSEAIDEEAVVVPTHASGAMTFYIRAIGLMAGDALSIRITGPDGQLWLDQTTAPLDRNKAQWFGFSGRRRPAQGWSRGQYRAQARLLRGGAVAAQVQGSLTL